MAAWFKRKQKATATQSESQDMFLELAAAEKLIKPLIIGILQHNQKEMELEAGLKYIVEQTDLTEENLIIRKNAISELIIEEITEIQAEVVGLNKVSEAIKESRYEELLQQVGTQVKQEENLHSNIRDINVGDQTTTRRQEAARNAKKSESEYKQIAVELNTKIDELKLFAGNQRKKLIESERATVALLINTLNSHLSKLKEIKTQMDSNPNLDQVKQAKKNIRNMLSAYNALDELDTINEIRKENDELENNLNLCFKEAGAIEDLQNQLLAKESELTTIIKQFRAESNLMVL